MGHVRGEVERDHDDRDLFANAWRKAGTVAMAAERRLLNGEIAVIVRIRELGLPLAVIHAETNGARIVALRIDRDPHRIGAFATS